VILEGIVTTLSAQGELNIAPMGPKVDHTWDQFVLRPFQTATTYRNLKEHPEGVLHVTDDVLLMARTALGFDANVPTEPAKFVRGRILSSACRYFEFKVTSIDDQQERASIVVQTVHRGVLREFFGFNRAKHAVLETAILATRIDFLPLDGIEAELGKYRIIVEKTGGTQETEAFGFLVDRIREGARRRGVDVGAI
jgi:hypothetical protein